MDILAKILIIDINSARVELAQLIVDPEYEVIYTVDVVVPK